MSSLIVCRKEEQLHLEPRFNSERPPAPKSEIDCVSQLLLVKFSKPRLNENKLKVSTINNAESMGMLEGILDTGPVAECRYWQS